MESFDGAVDWIDDQNAGDKVVLVHCAQGRSRSAAVCIAALVRQQRLSLVDALNFIRTRRSGVKPDSVLLEPLVLWEHKERSAAVNETATPLNAEELQKKVEDFARECGYISSVHATRQPPPPLRRAAPTLSSLVLRTYGDSLIAEKILRPVIAKGPTGWPELHALCTRFSRTDLPSLVRLAVYRDIERRIQAAGLHKLEGDALVPAILDFAEHHLAAARAAFHPLSDFGVPNAIAQSMRFLTVEYPPSNVLLARYLHRIFVSQQSTEEKSAAVRRVLPQLRFLNNPDAFADTYAPLFAQRVIQPRFDRDVEEIALGAFSRLRLRLLAIRLRLLHSDVLLGRHIGEEFATAYPTVGGTADVLTLPAHRCPTSWIRGPEAMPIDDGEKELPQGGSFGLTRSAWPKECILPTELDSHWMQYYKFWRERFPDKLIQFLPHMGSAEIKVTLDQSRFTLVVPTPLMSILLLFNRATSHSYEYVMENSGLSAGLATFALKSLLSLKAGGQNLLLKSPAGATFGATDVLSLNPKFKPAKKLLRFGGS